MKKIKFRASAKSNPQVASYLKAVNKGAKNQHVVPKDGQWAVKSANSAKATKVFDTQKEAVVHARTIAKNQKTGLFVHGQDGRIKDRISYSSS